MFYHCIERLLLANTPLYKVCNCMHAKMKRLCAYSFLKTYIMHLTINVQSNKQYLRELFMEFPFLTLEKRNKDLLKKTNQLKPQEIKSRELLLLISSFFLPHFNFLHLSFFIDSVSEFLDIL